MAHQCCSGDIPRYEMVPSYLCSSSSQQMGTSGYQVLSSCCDHTPVSHQSINSTFHCPLVHIKGQQCCHVHGSFSQHHEPHHVHGSFSQHHEPHHPVFASPLHTSLSHTTPRGPPLLPTCHVGVTRPAHPLVPPRRSPKLSYLTEQDDSDANDARSDQHDRDMESTPVRPMSMRSVLDIGPNTKIAPRRLSCLSYLTDTNDSQSEQDVGDKLSSAVRPVKMMKKGGVSCNEPDEHCDWQTWSEEVEDKLSSAVRPVKMMKKGGVSCNEPDEHCGRQTGSEEVEEATPDVPVEEEAILEDTIPTQPTSTKVAPCGKDSRKMGKGSVVLSNWYFKVTVVNDSCCMVLLQGTNSDDKLGRLWCSGPVVKWLSPRELATESGTVYHLKGPLDQTALAKVGINDAKISQSFKNGFPMNWLKLIEKQALEGKAVDKMKDGSPAFDKRKLQGGVKVKPKPKKRKTNVDNEDLVSSLKYSSSGRTIKPSVYNLSPYISLSSEVYSYDSSAKKQVKKEKHSSESQEKRSREPQVKKEKRSRETLGDGEGGDEEGDKDIPWSAADIKNLKSFVHATPAMEPKIWERVARWLGTGHSARECKRQYLKLTVNPLQRNHPQDRPTNVTTSGPTAITDRVGTMKRKVKRVQPQELSDEPFDEEDGEESQTIWTLSDAKWRLGAPSSFTPKQDMKRMLLPLGRQKTRNSYLSRDRDSDRDSNPFSDSDDSNSDWNPFSDSDDSNSDSNPFSDSDDSNSDSNPFSDSEENCRFLSLPFKQRP